MLGISFINLKGGVAKTTTMAVVAEMLDSEFGKKDHRYLNMEYLKEQKKELMRTVA